MIFEEVGFMLCVFGYGNDLYLYVVFGEVYNGEVLLVLLKVMFFNYYIKDIILN